MEVRGAEGERPARAREQPVRLDAHLVNQRGHRVDVGAGGRRDAPLHPLAMSPKYLAILATGILREVGAGEHQGASASISTPARARCEGEMRTIRFRRSCNYPGGKNHAGFPVAGRAGGRPRVRGPRAHLESMTERVSPPSVCAGELRVTRHDRSILPLGRLQVASSGTQRI